MYGEYEVCLKQGPAKAVHGELPCLGGRRLETGLGDTFGSQGPSIWSHF